MVAEWGECSNAPSGPPINVGLTFSNSVSTSIKNKKIPSTNNLNGLPKAKGINSVNTVDTHHFTLPNHKNMIISKVQGLASKDSYHDVLLLCEKRRIVAHKLILSSASFFFKSLLAVSSEKDKLMIYMIHNYSCLFY